MCGLKPIGFNNADATLIVTPFVGVWIETVDASVSLQKSQVTPFVGVWIETYVTGGKLVGLHGHTLRGCVD